ncbi:RNA polymerase sigma factor [Sphingomonas psychrotolerans]|uniref:RNA polymerase sigma factor n=1 Tax=Sphingomonas psychrotolerans TaxID=1327635 RepID=A0ABU3N8Y6_9SPHN|nr:RNA polymerase sigma factor [Sphingomonas psychrotolerans]MDT8760942.1 RNA polymerase sigma factor [Sphingomonas psychrotolerans]
MSGTGGQDTRIDAAVDGKDGAGSLRNWRRRATERRALAEWVGREILPHERDLRLWLQRRLVAAADVEDIVQECYCRLAQLPEVSHVTMPRAYLFTMARNLAQRQLKRARVVRIEAMTDDGHSEWESDLPSPERIAAAREELGRVQAALATLSERARRIFLMRKVEGLSQKEIAQAMGVSEAVVENEASRSLRTVLKLLTEAEVQPIGTITEAARARSR